MENLFTITRQNRKILHRYLQQLSKEELIKIPVGFNNNIWWNIAHVVVTQQRLVYGLSGMEMHVSQTLDEKYRKGTFPTGDLVDEEYEGITKLLFSAIEKTEVDYHNGVFTSFDAYMTSPKVPLNSVEDAIAFNVFHEGLHLGAILALQKAI
ncbi:MAG: DinB family protein [Bacteroidota bacterium]